MRLPPGLDARTFLERHWQKTPLPIPGAVDRKLPAISGDELAWLATLSDVESRLIVTDRAGDRTRYELEHGPFEETRFASLPPRDWTLLVQDVDKHLPEFRAWFSLVDFVPDWRIDDLMVSYAVPGGGAGPHSDSYDVFLVQAEGHREWRLAAAGAARPASGGGTLALLEPWDDPAPFTAGPGDVLYLPPGIPHWGTAQTPCLTLSIGFRAPTRADLDRTARLATGDRTGTVTAADARYADPDLEPEEATPGRISAAAIARTRKLLGGGMALDDDVVGRLLGLTVTEPKAALVADWLPRRAAADAAGAALGGDTVPVVHGMARLAYRNTVGGIDLFVNGRATGLPPAAEPVVSALCARRALETPELRRALGADKAVALLAWLYRCGGLARESER